MRIERKATLLATFIALILAIVKIVAGLISGSVALIASALDSILDMVISIFNSYALKISDTRPDKKFNYGKGKIEAIAGLLEGSLIILSGLYIIYEAITRIIEHKTISNFDLAIYVMLFSIFMTSLLVIFLNYVYKKTDNLVIKSDSLHYKTDLLTNLAILISFGVIYFTNFYYIDFILSILIGIYIIKEASEILKESIEILLDVSLDFNTVESIKNIIKSQPLVVDYHCLRTRKAGDRYFVDVHLVLSPEMKLKTAHSIIENVEDKIRELNKNVKWIINIHADPYDDFNINKILEECE